MYSPYVRWLGHVLFVATALTTSGFSAITAHGSSDPATATAKAPQQERLKEKDQLEGERDQRLAAGDFTGAIRVSGRVLDLLRDVLGDTHDDTRECLELLAYLNAEKGDFAAARQAARDALATAVHRYGVDNYRSADARRAHAYADQLAGLPGAQRKRLAETRALMATGELLYKEGHRGQAQPFFARAAELRQEVLGDHPLKAEALGWVGTALAGKGQAALAREYHEKALAIFLNVYGENHSWTGSAYFSIGDALRVERKYKEARAPYEKALAICLNTLGEEHKHTATVLEHLGYVLRQVSDHRAARVYYERALLIRLKLPNADDVQLASTYYFAGMTCYDLGDYTKSLEYLERSLALHDKVHGPEHSETATALHNLAWVRSAAGDSVGARPLQERALRIRIKLHGEDHPQTAQTRINLAALLGRLEDAQEEATQCERALAVFRKAYGDANTWTFTALNNLGMALGSLGRYTAARPYLEESLAIRRKMYGEEHASVAQALQNLGYLLKDQQDFVTARQCLEQALTMRRKLLGDDHPNTGRTYWILAELLEEQQDYATARPHLERYVAICRKVYGQQHRYTAYALNRLAGVLGQLREWEAARELHDQALAILQKVLSPEHPDVARTYGQLGALLQAQGKFGEARDFFEKQLAMHRKAGGNEAFALNTPLYNLAELERARGNYKEERRYREQALAIAQKTRAKDHPDVGAELYNLGGTLTRLADYVAAEQCLERALAIQRHARGNDHPKVAMVLHNLGTLRDSRGDFRGARACFEEALAIHRRNLGDDRPRVAATLQGLALVFIHLGEYAAARPRLDESLRILRRAYGKDHPETLTPLQNLAGLHRRVGNYAAARQTAEQVLAICRNAHGEDHPLTATALNDLGVLVSGQGDEAAALPHFRRALAIRLKVLGEDHVETTTSLANVGVTLMNQRDLAGARELFRRALRSRSRLFGENHPDLGHLVRYLGMIAHQEKRYDQAREHYERALAMWRTEDASDKVEAAFALTSLGELHRDLAEWAAARKHYETALALRQKHLGDTHLLTTYCLFSLGSLLIAQGDYAGARPFNEEGYRARAEQYRAVLGSLAEAEALSFVEHHRPGRNPLLSTLRHLPDARPAEAYQVVWTTRSLVARALAARRPPSGADPATVELWDRLRNTRSQLARLTLAPAPPDEQARDARSKQLARLVADKETLERELSAASAAYRRQREEEQAGPGDLVARLSANAAVLDLVRIELSEPPPEGKGNVQVTPHYEAFVLRRTDNAAGYAVAWVHLGPAEPIDRAVKVWREALVSRTAPPTGADAPEQAVRRLVWQPVEEHLAGCAAVIVIPDAALTGVPWVALPGKRPGSYLLEDYALATASHGQALLATLTRPATQRGGMLVVGGVHYDAKPAMPPNLLALRGPALDPQRRPTWAFLEGTEEEGRAIRALWPRSDRVTLLNGAAATPAALKQALPAARSVHLATHGFFADATFRSALGHDVAGERLERGAATPEAGRATVTGRNPLILSGVVLAGANAAPDSGGILTAEEVAELDLGNTEMVVLSACETGLGEVAGGEGVFGLQRAFHLAGVRTTVASLWKVDDQATQQLMTRFYDNLWRQQLAPAEALRQAQLSLLQQSRTASAERALVATGESAGGPGPATAHPWLWAPWVLSGDPGDLTNVQPVTLPASDPPCNGHRLLWLGVGAVGLLLTAGLGWRIGRRRLLLS